MAIIILMIMVYSPSNTKQVAARLAGVFSLWRKFDPVLRNKQKEQLDKLLSTEGLSKDTWEIVSQSLKI